MLTQIESLRPLIDPQSIAIIGASSDLTKIGGRPIKSLIDFKYQGRILPINPKYNEIAGIPCFPNINEVPGEIDLAIIVVPSSSVLSSVKDCGERGVRSIIIMSAGFAEVGDQGRQAQEEIISLAKKHKMRVLGPNTVGMFNLLTGAMANFGIETHLGNVPKGRIAVVSQSGAFCAFIYTLAAQNQIGLNYFIGTGNQSDVDIADCIAYLAEDPNTDVITCYIEGINDLDKLLGSLQLAARHKKPVIALKVGRSEAGRKAVLSHTASVAGLDAEYDAIFKQTGVYRVESVQELMDVAKACSYGIIPQGNRVAVFTISGGVGVILADHFTDWGINLHQPDQDVQKKLLELIPYASVNNPIDMTGQLVNQPQLLGDFMKAVLDKGSYDIVLTYIADLGYHKLLLEKFLAAIKEVIDSHPNIPQLMTTVCTSETKKMINDTRIAVFDDPLRMAKATKALCQFSENFAASEIADITK